MNPLGRRQLIQDPLPNQNKPKLNDFTQAVSIERNWLPIVRKPDAVPDNLIIQNKVQLKEWELNQNNLHMANLYDRRIIDQEVLRRFRMQGGTIQMYVDYKDLTKDENFWKQENDITKFAMLHMKELKELNTYDFHKLKP